MKPVDRTPDTRFSATGPFPEGTEYWLSESDRLFVIILDAGMYRAEKSGLYLVSESSRERLAHNLPHAGMQLSYEDYKRLLDMQS